MMNKNFAKYTIFPEIKTCPEFISGIDPSNLGKIRVSGKSKVITEKIYLGTAFDILNKLFNAKKSSQKIRPKEFGLPMAILKLAKERGEKINR